MIAIIQKIKQTSRNLLIWQSLFVIAAFAIPFTNWLTLNSAMQRVRFALMDSRDTVYLTSMGSFEEAKHFHAEAARLAAQNMYSRNPDGFDNPEVLERLFNPRTFKILNQKATEDADTFKAQSLHQKAEIGNIKEVVLSPTEVYVSVECALLRVGRLSNGAMNSEKRVTVFFHFTLNDQMATNGRFLLVVTDYKENIL